MSSSWNGHAFHSWEYERTPKRKGGRVYIAIGQRGDVSVHEGYLTCREAERIRRGEQGEVNRPARPEIGSALTSYVDLASPCRRAVEAGE